VAHANPAERIAHGRQDTRGMRAAHDLAHLTPAYFGLVMATGIVSLAADLEGWHDLAQGLFYVNIVFYAALWILFVLRFLRFRSRVYDDVVDHLHGQGFFTMVAGTSLVGSQFLLLARDDRTAAGFLVVTVILWIVFTYTIFTALTIKEHKPTLDQGISGGWLLAVVATQSIAVLAALLAARFGQPYKQTLNFFALSMWLWGGMLYIWLMSLIFYRYAFFRFFPGDLAPPYWINMGAMAISTLAGSLLIINASDAPYLTSLLPFLKGFTILYWATGTWWIPMLVLLGIWRHVYKRFPLAYDPLYWGVVFPLGMYSASTREMRHAMHFNFLDFIPPTFFVIALLAWTVTLAGLVRSLARRYRPRLAVE